MSHSTDSGDALLDAALAGATDTKCLRIGPGVLRETADIFAGLYGAAPALIIADDNTFAAAGRDVYDALRAAGHAVLPPLILHGPDLHAEYTHVDQVRAAIAATDAVPVAVGSGTINDLTKLASHQVKRPYVIVATAASMDGYTSFGASITFEGSKQTFECPAPQAVIADLDVIVAAPEGMNASGYADLIAKVPAGACWLAADACNEDKIDAQAWETVQHRLRQWCADPEGVRLRRPEAMQGLITGLMMTGFAMQASLSSRPASGAEHLFSHLWDMEHHTHQGITPSHGFKVGIGSLASIAMHETLLDADLARLDVQAAVASWPDAAAIKSEIASLFPVEALAERSRQESLGKLLSPPRLLDQLTRLKAAWPELAPRLRAQLIPYNEFRAMLIAAGAPGDCRQIGITPERLHRTCYGAYHLRRRYTVLDLARRTGMLEPCAAAVAARAGTAA